MKLDIKFYNGWLFKITLLCLSVCVQHVNLKLCKCFRFFLISSPPQCLGLSEPLFQREQKRSILRARCFDESCKE